MTVWLLAVLPCCLGFTRLRAPRFAWQLAAPFMHPDAIAILNGQPGSAILMVEIPVSGISWLPWLSTTLALGIAGFELLRPRIPGSVGGLIDRLVKPVQNGLGIVHSGRIGDYVMWIMVGLGRSRLPSPSPDPA